MSCRGWVGDPAHRIWCLLTDGHRGLCKFLRAAR